MNVHNTDARTLLRSLESETIQCIVCDPPFGLGEDEFDQKHYARDASQVLGGYVTAPKGAAEYEAWARTWIHEIPRVLKPDGTLYIVCAWNHVTDIELAIRSAPKPGLQVLNHIIWKFNFGVWTQKKFVTSHYHILRCGVGTRTPFFEPRAFFSEKDQTASGGSAQYVDMEDVWVIPKEFAPGTRKNANKLPDALVRKMLLYSSRPGDLVADFFLGNFTTAYVARQEGRRFVGAELNPEAFQEHAEAVRAIQPNPTAAKDSTRPANAGRRITDEERSQIKKRFAELTGTKKSKLEILEAEFGRGRFSLARILEST